MTTDPTDPPAHRPHDPQQLTLDTAVIRPKETTRPMTIAPPRRHLSLVPANGTTGWTPTTQADLAPAGAKHKVAANMAALRTLRTIQGAERAATPAEKAILARWAGWGAVPGMFEGGKKWEAERTELATLLDTAAMDAARRTTINAHYTDAAVVSALWEAVTGLGFDGGRILEPGCGSGNFIGLAPADVNGAFVGVELDPTTAAIAAALYPDADIRATGFEAAQFPLGHFDLTVGNVPFAQIQLYDPVLNRARYNMHNYFITKALHLTRPGGLVAVLTSRFTLDSRNSAARADMASMADLVGAVRLPAGSMRAAAGTEAIIDVLILRRREEGAAHAGESFSSLVTVPVDDGEVEISEYFGRNPGHVLGKVVAHGGQYGRDDLDVRPGPEPLAGLLGEALGAIVTEAQRTGLTFVRGDVPPAPTTPTPPTTPPRTPRRRRSPAAAGLTLIDGNATLAPPVRKTGSIILSGAGFAQVRVPEDDTLDLPFHPRPAKEATELRRLVQLRDVMAHVLSIQSSTDDDAAFAVAADALNRCYDAYVAAHGPISRYSLARTGRVDPDTGEDRTRMMRPRLGGFRDDPDMPSLLALEIFDGDSQTAVKAPIFAGRVVAPRTAHREASTPTDALSICLDQTGTVDMDVIAGLLSITPEAARDRLGNLVWLDPATRTYEPAARYLSGNVRSKLTMARLAAGGDESFEANVEALEAVVPPDLGAAEINARLGAPWISKAIIAQFVTEVLGVRADNVLVDHAPVTATWAVRVAAYERHTVVMSSTFGTGRADAIELLESSLNQGAYTVTDPHPDEKGRRIPNPAETMAAREKQAEMNERFAEWVWEDPDRSRDLVEIYNVLFNSTVVPTYDGSHLTLPGLADNFTPHPHQLDSVWRIIQEPTVLLAHPVGSGKTLTICAGLRELRRLGLIRKPMIVVPNHLLDQFTREFLQHYPLADVLMATKELTTKANRKEFVARCATGDWDAIIITRSAFEKIPVTAAAQAAYIDRQLDGYKTAIEASEGLTVKKLETAMAKMEQRKLDKLAEHRKDDGINFEASGVDYVAYDEAHGAKNLAFPTRIQGAGGNGSQRAEDLRLKLDLLRQVHGARVCTFATATPISNTIAEMWVMQMFLQPEAMEEAGIAHFDAWAANFGEVVMGLELAPDGSSYRITGRFAKFRNVPELLGLFRMVADVRTPEELNLPTPAIAGGEAETVVIPSSPAQAEYLALLAERAQKVKGRAVDPSEDNMLKVCTDGRKMALHIRLVGGAEDEGYPGKVDVAADRIAAHYHAHCDNRFRDHTGGLAEREGSFQMVFGDMGTPHDGEWSPYEQLRTNLVTRGVPADRIRFIHSAADDMAKAQLFAACRDGRVAVLVGSTEKMGTGTNVQTRLSALHHLDAPWRPADIEQRDGRGLRQGNQNAQVEIVRYVTEATFDVYMWQTLARKARFIWQVMRGEVGREIDDVGDVALSFAEVKALATGNPLLLEQAGVENELARLTRRKRAFGQDQTRLSRLVVHSGEAIEHNETVLAQVNAALPRRVATAGDAFTMTVAGRVIDKRVDAGTALKRQFVLPSYSITQTARTEVVAQLGGFDVSATWHRDWHGSHVEVRVVGTPLFWAWTMDNMVNSDAGGLISRLEHGIATLEGFAEAARGRIDRAHSEIADARSRLDRPFPDEADFRRFTQRSQEISDLLTAEAQAQAQQAADEQAQEVPA